MAKEQEAEPDHGPIESSFQPTKESDLAASPSKQPDILEDAADLGLEESASNDARLDKIYRYLIPSIAPQTHLPLILACLLPSSQKTRPPNHPRLLAPLLPLRRRAQQRQSGADNE